MSAAGVDFGEREKWLQARAHVLGGSDVSALFTIEDETGRTRSANPYKSTFELFGEKMGLLDPSKEETEAMYWGKVLEPFIARRYSEETKREVNLLGYTIYRAGECDYLGTTPDGEVYTERGRGIVSIKNVDLFRWKRQTWDDELPPFIQMQLQAELAATNATWGSFALLVGGNRFHWKDVDRNDLFIEVLFKKVREFKQRLDDNDPPPVDSSERTADALRRLYSSTTGDTIKLPERYESVVAALAQAKADVKDATDRERGARNELIAAIGNATIAEMESGAMFKRTVIEKKPFTVNPKPYVELRRIDK